jgi:NAD(P)-dependent dehydrogenase (short-subunit alcohol dehydrogenase family)
VKTPIFGKIGFSDEHLSAMVEKVPMKRMAEPDEIAKSVLFLASPDSAFYLGAELVADGGMSQL